MVNKLFLFVSKYYALLIGVGVATTLAAIASHSDFFYISKMAERVASGNLHIYDNLIVNGVDYGKFIMPPTIFLLDGGLFYIFKLLHIINFSFGLYEIPTITHNLLLKSRFILLLILSYPLVKQTALVFTKNNEAASRRIVNIWIVSPVLLYLTFTQGNNDIYPTLLSITFLLFAFKKKYILAMIFLGLAAAAKNYALFLIPPMAIILADKNLIKTIKYSAISLGIYLIPVLFYVGDIKRFFTGGGEGLFILETVLPAHFNYMVFPILYVFLLCFLYFNENGLSKDKSKDIVLYGFLTLSLFFATSFFIPQWFLWILPFFVLLVYKNNKLFSLYVIIVTVFLFSLLTNWSNNLDLQLYRPVLPMNLAEVTMPGSVKIISFVSSIFVGLYFSFIYILTRNTRNLKEDEPKMVVLKSLLPLVALLLVIAGFAVISSKITKDAKTISSMISNNDYALTDEITNNEINGPESVNAKQNNDSLKAITNDPMIIVKTNKEIKSSRDNPSIVLVKYKGDKFDPQLYWNKENNFSESLSNTKFHSLGNGVFWTKIDRILMGIEIKKDYTINYLRFDPARKATNFEVEYIKVIRLNN